MFKIKNKRLLDVLKNNIEGELAYVEEDQKVYEYHKESGWSEAKKAEINTGMTLYEMNQQVIGSMPVLDEYTLSVKEEFIRKFIKDKKGKYYMLLCNDLHYYTVFVTGLNCAPKENGPIQREITTCLFHMGEVKSVEETGDGNAIEIWITDENNHSYVFYLFPYDKGVIECE